MYDICCVGHITLDKVVTPQSTVYMAGGTSFYFSNAIHKLDVHYQLVTALSEKEMLYVTDLREAGIAVTAFPSRHTVFFENIYPEHSDHRIQNVLATADAFTIEQLKNINAAIFHLGPLLADDIPVALIEDLAARSIVSLDVQGYLRKVTDQKVIAIDWAEKKEALQHVSILKASESEMTVLTGHTDIKQGAITLAGWGAKEVVITAGSKGSVIYSNNVFYNIPAFIPRTTTDATGCGDTYMAGYLYKRHQQAGIQEAGEFAAAMASLKIESSGPFKGGEEEVLQLMQHGERNTPSLL
ncbi:MAG: PfkB family carbohydrate kinase [Chitinophagaceae bacterium]